MYRTEVDGGPDAKKNDMRLFSQTADAIAGTTSKLKKIGFLAEYLRTLNEEDLRAACVFFTGRPFALTDARTFMFQPLRIRPTCSGR